MEIIPPEDMDLEQYIAAETLKKQVEKQALPCHAANHLLRKGLGLKYDYFDEDGKSPEHKPYTPFEQRPDPELGNEAYYGE